MCCALKMAPASAYHPPDYISHESELSSLPESQDMKEHEKQLQVLESPVNTLEQQLKSTEAHYGTEIPTVQGSFETIHGRSAHPSVDSMVFKDSDIQKTVCRGNCRPDHVIIIIEGPPFFPDSLAVGM